MAINAKTPAMTKACLDQPESGKQGLIERPDKVDNSNDRHCRGDEPQHTLDNNRLHGARSRIDRVRDDLLALESDRNRHAFDGATAEIREIHLRLSKHPRERIDHLRDRLRAPMISPPTTAIITAAIGFLPMRLSISALAPRTRSDA